MKIEVKKELCIGAGACLAVAPNVYKLDDEMKAVVTNPKGADEDVILESAKACPTLAIYIYDDDNNQIFPPVSL